MFEVPRTIYNLEWDDEAYAGLVVRVRAMTVREALDGYDTLWAIDNSQDLNERRERVRQQHEMFMSHVVEWNLCENGEPIPATVEGLQSMEGTFVGSMISAWLRNSVGVSRPLDDSSTDGDLSAMESIPMESLSESLAS